MTIYRRHANITFADVFISRIHRLHRSANLYCAHRHDGAHCHATHWGGLPFRFDWFQTLKVSCSGFSQRSFRNKKFRFVCAAQLENQADGSGWLYVNHITFYSTSLVDQELKKRAVFSPRVPFQETTCSMTRLDLNNPAAITAYLMEVLRTADESPMSNLFLCVEMFPPFIKQSYTPWNWHFRDASRVHLTGREREWAVVLDWHTQKPLEIQKEAILPSLV